MSVDPPEAFFPLLSGQLAILLVMLLQAWMNVQEWRAARQPQGKRGERRGERTARGKSEIGNPVEEGDETR